VRESRLKQVDYSTGCRSCIQLRHSFLLEILSNTSAPRLHGSTAPRLPDKLVHLASFNRSKWISRLGPKRIPVVTIEGMILLIYHRSALRPWAVVQRRAGKCNLRTLVCTAVLKFQRVKVLGHHWVSLRNTKFGTRNQVGADDGSNMLFTGAFQSQVGHKTLKRFIFTIRPKIWTSVTAMGTR
jgi:hypothetical protein